MTDRETADARSIPEDVVHRLRTELGESEESIRAMPDETLRRAILKVEHPDRARRRIEHELGPLRDDQGVVDAEARERARQQAEQMQVETPPGLACGMPTGQWGVTTPARAAVFDAGGASRGVLRLAGLMATAGWDELGPDNIGGRTRAIAIDPTDTDRILAVSAGGGVWLSTNGGATWAPTDDHMGNLAVCSLAIKPGAPATVLAGTGEGFGNADAIRGNGIYRSSDGGITWTHLGSTSSSDFHYVNSLAYSFDGSTLLVGTREGVFRSTDDGMTWTQTSTRRIGNIATHPTDPQRAIAGCLAVGAALFTTDGGENWSAAAIPLVSPGRIQVCYAAADPETTYASVDVLPSAIWRSTDGGQSYAARSALSGGGPASYLGQQGWYDNVIWAGDPTDADLVLVGGIDLWRSTDGGDHLEQISTWWSDASAHADHHAIVSDPGYDGTANRRAYFGNDGGIHRAIDVRTVGNNASPPYDNGWTHLNGGYAVTQFYYGAGHIGTNTIIGGTQDNGTLRYTPAGGTSWNKVYGGDGGSCASDPTDPSIWYGEYVYLQVFRNSNGGASSAATEYISGRHWNGMAWVWKSEPYTIPDARDSDAQFIAPFVLDPNDADRLLGGGQSLWLCTDPKTPNTPTTGPSWRAIKAPIGSTRTTTITEIAVADGDSDTVVVGHANGDVYRSTDATATTPTWTQIDTNGIGANRQCLGLAIDPDDHDVIYATFGGYQAGNVWYSDDGGASWTDITGALPAAPVRSITLHPQRSSWVYVGTEVGLFASEDRGVTWSPTNEGPASVAVHDLFWLGCRLVTATHGRGMFEIDLVIADAYPDPVLAFAGTENYRVDGQDFVRYRLEVTNWADYPSSLFRPSPDLPPCGLNSQASRTWIDIFDATSGQRMYGFCAFDSNDDLQRLWFAVPAGATPPASVHIELRDRRCNQTYRSNAVAPSAGVTPPVVEERRITMADQVDGAVVRVAGPWGVATLAEVIASLDSRTATYYIEAGGKRAKVSVVNGRTKRYLRSYGDRTAGNNLDALPPVI